MQQDRINNKEYLVSKITICYVRYRMIERSKMRKKFIEKIKAFLATAFVLTIIGGTQTFAALSIDTYCLPANKILSATTAKTSNTDKVAYKLYAVYPTGNYEEDTYTRIKISSYYGSTQLMSERVVYEGAAVTTYNYASIKNLSSGDNVTFKLRGNTPSLAAFATVYLNWY